MRHGFSSVNDPNLPMIIYINGRVPNAAIVLEAETQAECDQIKRLKNEAAEAVIEVANQSHDTRETLRLRLTE
jgi:hypothetical protein